MRNHAVPVDYPRLLFTSPVSSSEVRPPEAMLTCPRQTCLAALVLNDDSSRATPALDQPKRPAYRRRLGTLLHNLTSALKTVLV